MTRDTIVLAVTAFAMKSDERKALEAGCDGYITKPIDTRTFPALIRQYLNRSSETSEGGVQPPSRETTNTELCLGDMRRQFAAEGVDQSERLVNQFGAAFDREKALITAHRWAGAAGSIGYPEITRIARDLEAVLQKNGSGSMERTRQLLMRLAGLFAEALKSDQLPSPAPTPGEEAPSKEADSIGVPLGLLSASQEAGCPAVLATLAGKRFALSGFPPAEVVRLAKAIEACQAFSRDLGTLLDAEAVRPFDAVILNVVSLANIPQLNKPVLMIGQREVLLQQPVHNAAQDFLFAPWTTDELILRSYFAIYRAAQGRAAQPATSAAGRRRVVIADDDSTIRALVEAAVGNAGLECRAASDGGAALELIRSWQPDLAVLDVNMPNRSGYEVLSSLRNDPLTREIRVILLTARQQETDVIRGFGLGADDYVIKPFSPMELIARLKRLLGKNV